MASRVHTKHGHVGNNKPSKIYEAWHSMIQRCTNPNHKYWKDYGGRGIIVCERWLESFENFLEDMCEATKGYQIDRINNDGNYESNNCKWSTPKEQQRNRRNNLLITHKGKTQCLAAWAEEYNISYDVLWSRLYKYNWSIEKALITPIRSKGK